MFLQVSKTDSKSWLFRYRWKGKRPEIGLGSFSGKTLAEARNAMGDCRKLIRAGIDPHKRDKITGEASTPTFSECAAQFIRDRKSEWSNAKHQAQWTSTLQTYAEPIIGHVPVDQVDLDHMLAILTPIWQEKTDRDCNKSPRSH